MYQWVRFSLDCKSTIISTNILAAHVQYACYIQGGCMIVHKSMDHVGHCYKDSNIGYQLRNGCSSDIYNIGHTH